MALLKAVEVRAMNPEDRRKKLTDLRGELMNERGVAAMGGSPASPGKIRQLRTAIARLLTIENQERAGHVQYAKGEKPRVATAPPARKPAPAAPKKAPTSRQGHVASKKSEASKAHAAKKTTKAAKPKTAKHKKEA